MENHPRICEILVDTKAFRDLVKPVILTSGELGIYYVNTEKLVQDDNEWEKFGNDAKLMIQHAVRMMDAHPTYREVIEIMAEKVKYLLRGKNDLLVSGGQRRDWIFSGPVAHLLTLPHLALYNAGDKIGKHEVIIGKNIVMADARIANHYIVHVSDLITSGSSAYNEMTDKPSWIPMIQKKDGIIEHMVNVVTRQQGGEKNLAKAKVKSHSFVAIDEDFLRRYSIQPEVSVAYVRNPRQWSTDYITAEGIGAFVEFFDPKGKKLDRAQKFLLTYDKVLKSTGNYEKLEMAVKGLYSTNFNDLFGRK